MKKKWLAIFSCVLLVVVCVSFVGKNVVIAAGKTTGGVTKPGGGGSPSVQSGCPQEMDTCYGARWQYYTWQDAWNNGFTIQGTSESPNTLYRTIHVSAEEAAICKEAGGYFRYAFVKRSNNQQIGVAGIASYSVGLSSEKMISPSGAKGGVHYREPSEDGFSVSWETVMNAYNIAKDRYPTVIPQNGFSWGSDLGFFCASYDGNYSCPEDVCPPDKDDIDPDCSAIAEPTGFVKSTEKEGWSSVRTQVRKTNIFGNFTNEVWAKPGDSVQWRHCYFPGMQKVANQKVTFSNDGTVHKNTKIGVGKTSIDVSDRTFPLTNGYMKNVSDWDNLYHIVNRVGGVADHDLTKHDAGDAEIRKVDNNWSVEQDWVGTTQQESSSLDTDLHGGKTPYHAWVGTPESDHKWDCTWTHTITKTGDDAENDTKHCWRTADWSECVGGNNYTYCEDITDKKTKCGCNQGSWEPHKYYVTPCSYDVDSVYKCTHGTGDSGTYYPYKANKDLYTGDKSTETAYVKVPYNFDMSATIELKDEYVYAGEAAALSKGSVSVNARYNSTTNGNYSTRAPGVKVQIMTFVSDNPVNSVPDSASVRYGEEIPIGDMSADETKQFSDFKVSSVNVDDIPAGKYFCVAVQVSPGSSGSETTMDPSGFTGYKKSGADCRQIAKRPSVQIWGGNLFANGTVKAARSEKNNLSGFADRPYTITGVNNKNVFGSWAEHSVMTISTNTGFASGAATSNRLGDTGSHGVGRFESKTGGFCKYEVPLTFANLASKKGESICGGTNTSTAGLFGTAVVADKSSYVESLLNGKDKLDSTPYKNDIPSYHMTLGQDNTYSIIKTATGKEILVTKYNGDKSIGIDASNIDLKKTYVVYSSKTVNINGNIIYANGASDSDSIPKVVIYSKGNIGIKCGVTRVDAVLISEKSVNTCAGYTNDSDLNATERSTPLIINGTIIANGVSFTRTYGGSIGAYSGIPAEVVNYDSSLVMWGREHADTSQTGVMTTTYTRELAPRY